MRRAVAVLVAVLATGCGGGDEPERELVPGSRIRIGVVAGERLVAEGARVEVNRIDNAGGIGGAATITLVRGTADELLGSGVRLLLLPCRKGLVAAARLVERRRALAIVPCDDGVLDPRLRRIFPSGLSPRAQAEALTDYVGGRAGRILPPQTARGGRVRTLLRLESGGTATVSPDAVEVVVPPPDVPDGTTFATYGFPDPGNRTDEFYERFKAVYGRRPESIVAALAADALDVLALAIETAGSPQPGLVAAELRKGIEVRGVLGTITYPGGTSRPEVEAAIVRLTDGRLRLIRSG